MRIRNFGRPTILWSLLVLSAWLPCEVQAESRRPSTVREVAALVQPWVVAVRVERTEDEPPIRDGPTVEAK
ncbi:MAG: hypothetical protein AAF488_14030, partial [Planctomycetota bacterium]